MNSLLKRQILFAAVIFLAASSVMYGIWIMDDFFADRRGLLPYAISAFLTLGVARISWLISRKLVK